VHHSDQGSAYVGSVCQALIAQLGTIASMSRKGNAYDNAVVESFFSNLKNELVLDLIFATRDQVRGRDLRPHRDLPQSAAGSFHRSTSPGRL